MRLKISHSTRYEFKEPVRYGLQQLRKTPKSTHGQQVKKWSTEIVGGVRELAFEDFHNNAIELVRFGGLAETLEITSTGEVELRETHGVVGRHLGPAPLWLYQRQTPRTKPGPGIRALVKEVATGQDLDRLHGLMHAVKAAVAYETGTSQADWTAEDALEAGRGVCQDHAHVFISAARELGFPARYVSGYLMLEDRVEQGAMHAWGEAHVDGLGWVGFDPANGMSPDAKYVRVATGLDYAEAAPVTGTQVGGGGEKLSVSISVELI